MEAAGDRLATDWRATFDARVDAVRIGTIIAHDRKAATRWQAMRQRANGTAAMTAQALEGAIAGLARQHPEYVVMGA